MGVFVCLCCRESQDGREGVVLLQFARPEVPDGDADQQGNGSRLLESDWQGQGRDEQPSAVTADGYEEDAGVLQGTSTQGWENQLDHAWVSTGGGWFQHPSSPTCSLHHQQQQGLSSQPTQRFLPLQLLLLLPNFNTKSLLFFFWVSW